jgi:hypothetical protein
VGGGNNIGRDDRVKGYRSGGGGASQKGVK